MVDNSWEQFSKYKLRAYNKIKIIPYKLLYTKLLLGTLF